IRVHLHQGHGSFVGLGGRELGREGYEPPAVVHDHIRSGPSSGLERGHPDIGIREAFCIYAQVRASRRGELDWQWPGGIRGPIMDDDSSGDRYRSDDHYGHGQEPSRSSLSSPALPHVGAPSEIRSRPGAGVICLTSGGITSEEPTSQRMTRLMLLPPPPPPHIE